MRALAPPLASYNLRPYATSRGASFAKKLGCVPEVGIVTNSAVAEIDCRLMQAHEIPAAAALLGDVFSRYEPLAIAVGQSSAEVQQVVSIFGAKAVSEQLTFIAHERAGDAAVGVALVHDFGVPPPSRMQSVGGRFEPIAELLGQLEASYRRARRIQPRTHAHIFMIGVVPQMAGRGAARQLIASVLANAKKRGYQFAFTEATSVASQRAFRSSGFREVDAAPYLSFEHNGQRPFASVEAPEGALLMEREL